MRTPQFIKIKTIFFSSLILLWIALCTLSSFASEPNPIPFKLKQDPLVFKTDSKDLNQAVEIMLFDQTNYVRNKQKLKPLELNDLLSKIARLYSEDMLKRNYFSHYSPEGKTVLDRIRRFKPHYDESCSENLHFISSANPLHDSFAIVDQMMADWMSSPPHRKNLLSKEYVLIGIGCSTDGKRIYCTQVFSGPEF